MHTTAVPSASSMQRRRCQVCGHADKMEFIVTDHVWRTVVPVPLQASVVCLACFDDFASDHGIDYSAALGTIRFVGEAVTLVLALTDGAVVPPPATRSEQTLRGLARARAAGKRIGRQPRLLSDEQVELARKLRAGGASWAEIAEKTGSSIASSRRACGAMKPYR